MEDYNEMVFVETILKKIGFDCTGVQNDNNLADKILSFSPHLIIGDGMGRKINGIGLSQKIKKWQTKSKNK
jgi:DNA-binding response OmpR family regulator